MSKINRSKEKWIGFQMNKLTVVDKLGEETKSDGRINDRLLVHCGCGNEFETLAGSLIHNKPLSCRGCSKMKPCIGKRSGNLVVSGFHRTRSKTRSILWYDCDCDCGGQHTVKSDIFNIGDCTSCKDCRVKDHKQHYSPTTFDKYFRKIRSEFKRRSSTQGMDFDITLDDVIEQFNRQSGKCQLSGREISVENGTASIDRIDSSRGYTSDNIQWLHRMVNFMKQSFDQDDFISMCSSVAQHSVLTQL